jgi:hypothetical protein
VNSRRAGDGGSIAQPVHNSGKLGTQIGGSSMAQPEKKPSLAEVLKLVDRLSPEDLVELRHQLEVKASNLNWSNINLQNTSERADFYKVEEDKAGLRVRESFEKLKKQGIMDEHGNVIKPGPPDDMAPGSEYDVGGY